MKQVKLSWAAITDPNFWSWAFWFIYNGLWPGKSQQNDIADLTLADYSRKCMLRLEVKRSTYISSKYREICKIYNVSRMNTVMTCRLQSQLATLLSCFMTRRSWTGSSSLVRPSFGPTKATLSKSSRLKSASAGFHCLAVRPARGSFPFVIVFPNGKSPLDSPLSLF